jgi:SAM-dependent methyltransferase
VVSAVEASWGEGSVALFSPTFRRADVAAAHPSIVSSGRSGFRAVLGLGNRHAQEAEFEAILEDGSRVSIGKIKMRRKWMRMGEIWRRLAAKKRRDTEAPPVGAVRFGDLRRLTPVSSNFGYDRGTPIDRTYIEGFLARNAGAIRGRVLEIGDDAYTRRFGSGHVTKIDVLHVREGNPKATLVGDLTNAPQIPSDTFDCIILTQTLHHIYDVRAALATVHRILKPGGVLLASAPGISQIASDEWGSQWFWSFTDQSLRRLLEESFGSGNVEIETRGNVLASVAFLEGLATEDLRRDELDRIDPRYPLVVLARAAKA